MAMFPDIPEALTGAATEAEALDMARDALIAAMDFYFEDRRPVPTPSEPTRGQATVELPSSLIARVLRLNEMLAQPTKE
jgi:antitoxin HicB